MIKKDNTIVMENMPVFKPSVRDYSSEKNRLNIRLMQGYWNYILTTAATICGVSILFIIFGHIIINGISAINFDFFTQLPKPYGEVGGGIAQAILGTIEMLGFAGMIAVPIGMGAAVFIVEYGNGKIAALVRFCIEMLAELPSIVVGVFVWALLVRYVTGYSAIAGAVALAIIMIPIIARSVEEILLLVPDTMREAALALGTPKWKVIVHIVIPTVFPGIVTSIFLSLARASGETAPLLLTALGNSFFNFDLKQPMSAIPLQIYNYAISPYDDWHHKAWAATLILIVVVALLSWVVRLFTRRYKYEKE